MLDRRKTGRRLVGVLAAVACMTVPLTLAGPDPAPLGVDSGAEHILRTGYHLERQTSEAGSVTVRVLYGEKIVGSATGRTAAPARNARDMEAPCLVRAPQDDPYVAVMETEREPINTP